MKRVQFYLLNQSQIGDYAAIETQACDLATAAWRSGQRVLIACENETQANNIDELLWARDVDSFVPHNLAGEVTQYPTPIEIAWKGKRNAQRRDVLISLQNEIPEFVNVFQQIIDFVPVDESEKAQARERYKQYRQMGWQLETVQV